MLLQEDLIQVLPMVAEANAMAEELNKGVKFEITLVSPQARGLKNGRTEVSLQLLISIEVKTSEQLNYFFLIKIGSQVATELIYCNCMRLTGNL